MKTTSIANAVTKPVENTAKSKKRICFAFIPALLLAGAYAAKIIFPFNFSFYLTELVYMWGWFILALITLAKKSNWLIIGGVSVAVLLPKFFDTAYLTAESALIGNDYYFKSTFILDILCLIVDIAVVVMCASLTLKQYDKKRKKLIAVAAPTIYFFTHCAIYIGNLFSRYYNSNSHIYMDLSEYFSAAVKVILPVFLVYYLLTSVAIFLIFHWLANPYKKPKK